MTLELDEEERNLLLTAIGTTCGMFRHRPDRQYEFRRLLKLADRLKLEFLCAHCGGFVKPGEIGGHTCSGRKTA